MYYAPTGYDDAVSNEYRVETIVMSLGLYIDNTTADDLSDVDGSSLPMSNDFQLVDSRYDLDDNLATYEADGIPTAINAGMIVPPLESDSRVNTGWWSSALSDADGNISFSAEVTFSASHTSALTIYTAGPNILAGTVVFSDNGTEEEVELDCHQGYAVASGNFTYDSFTINITEIDAPYKHIRITEFEFGDSVTISPAKLANEITFIDEIDPLQQGMPLRELDFDLINVNGDYDEDNPNGRYDRLAIGNPITLSYVIMSSARQYTIPMGRFILAEKGTNGNCMSVVAYDTRWFLAQMYNPWNLSTGEDLGTTLNRLLDSVEVAHQIDASVYSVYPTINATFTNETSLLDDLQIVAQAYGLTILPSRAGTVLINTDFPSDDYGNVPPNIQFSWPESSQATRYNYIDIAYGTGQHYTRDLRTSENTARVVLSVNNPLITTENDAETVCNRIVSRIFSKVVKVKWASDPALDLYDEVGVFSRWTLNQTPAVYRPVKREITFNGMLKEETTFIL